MSDIIAAVGAKEDIDRRPAQFIAPIVEANDTGCASPIRDSLLELSFEAATRRLRTRSVGALKARGCTPPGGGGKVFAGGEMAETQPNNPLLERWTGPFEAPPFGRIRAEHFRPAFDAALEEARGEIAAIAANSAPATFQNTIEALERGGRALSKISAVFFNLARTDGDDRDRGDRARGRASAGAPSQRHFSQQGAFRPRRRIAGGA